MRPLQSSVNFRGAPAEIAPPATVSAAAELGYLGGTKAAAELVGPRHLIVVTGKASPFAELHCPLTGAEAMILEHRASAPGAVSRMYGGLTVGVPSLAFLREGHADE